MKIRTIEDDFEYQVKEVFKDMQEDYISEQQDQEENGEDVKTFAEWLWENRADFGERMYERFDEYAGIEESTEDLNFEN